MLGNYDFDRTLIHLENVEISNSYLAVLATKVEKTRFVLDICSKLLPGEVIGQVESGELSLYWEVKYSCTERETARLNVVIRKVPF